MKGKKSILAVGVVVGIELSVLLIFATLLGIQVTAQQQITPGEAHHAENNNSNQSGSGMAEQQQQNTTTLSGLATKNQTFNTNWISLVGGVKVTGISVIGTDHISVNLRYDGEGEPPGVSVVAVAVDVTNSSSDRIISSNMMQKDSMMRAQEEEMIGEMIMPRSQQSNSSIEQESQKHDQQQMQNSTSTSNSNVPISSMQSGSNYLEAGWQGHGSNSATLLVQLGGDIPEGGHIMVIVLPFLHR
ncbi:MAG: hypothetical protein ACM3TS_00010 [Clostridia bacterium]